MILKPGMVIMAPSDELELMHMVATSASIGDQPSAFRYPRVRQKNLLDLKRGDIFTTPSYAIPHAVDKMKLILIIQAASVTGVKP